MSAIVRGHRSRGVVVPQARRARSASSTSRRRSTACREPRREAGARCGARSDRSRLRASRRRRRHGARCRGRAKARLPCLCRRGTGARRGRPSTPARSKRGSIAGSSSTREAPGDWSTTRSSRSSGWPVRARGSGGREEHLTARAARAGWSARAATAREADLRPPGPPVRAVERRAQRRPAGGGRRRCSPLRRARETPAAREVHSGRRSACRPGRP